MSFAYIDSQGKEVPIPGPDALRLRIELGAIKDDTQFYDSTADRWAAASEHEIYRQLKRDLDDAAGFVAPPPSTIEPVSTTDPVEEDLVLQDPVIQPPVAEEPVIEDVVVSTSDLVPDPPIEPPLDPVADVTSPGDFDFGSGDLTLADDLESDELSPPVESSEPLPPVETPPVETPEVELSGDDILEFGSDEFTFHDGSDAVGGEAPAEEPEPTPQWDVSADLAGSAPLPGDRVVEAPEDPEDLDVAEEEPDFGMAFEGVGITEEVEGTLDMDPGPVVGGDLEVESSAITDFDPDNPPAWMDDPVELEEDDAPADDPPSVVPPVSTPADAAYMDESDLAEDDGDAPDPYERTIRERTGPRAAPPQRQVTPKGAGAMKVLGLVAALLVVGVGGYYALDRMGGADAGAESMVQLPELPADLQPQLRQLAQRASQRMVEAFDSLPQRVALAETPGGEWLSGNYLGNASAFADIRAYWVEFGELLDEMIASENPIWRTAFQDEVVEANMSPEHTELVRERGLAGWEAASPDRAIVYDQLRRVIAASVRLHDFLLENESNITYNRAIGGGSGDPVLEAVPATPELGEEMWEQVGDITSALDALGYLQQVETEPLFGIVKEKLVATGIR